LELNFEIEKCRGKGICFCVLGLLEERNNQGSLKSLNKKKHACFLVLGFACCFSLDSEETLHTNLFFVGNVY